MRVINAEDLDTMRNPQFEDVANGRVNPLGIAVEVQGINVLILLWGIFGVGDGAVGTLREPVGMLTDPRVIGRAL